MHCISTPVINAEKKKKYRGMCGSFKMSKAKIKGLNDVKVPKVFFINLQKQFVPILNCSYIEAFSFHIYML